MNKIKESFTKILNDEYSAGLVSDLIKSKATLPTEENFTNLIGSEKARIVSAALNLIKCDFVCERKGIYEPNDFLSELYPLKFAEQEHFVLLSLNASNVVINKTVITKGTVNNTLIHPREVFRQALLDNAVSIAIAHNHPSGSLEPSSEDIAVTRVICSAGKIMRIPVIDHIIIGRGGVYSLCRTKSDLFEKTIYNEPLQTNKE